MNHRHPEELFGDEGSPIARGDPSSPKPGSLSADRQAQNDDPILEKLFQKELAKFFKENLLLKQLNKIAPVDFHL